MSHLSLLAMSAAISFHEQIQNSILSLKASLKGEAISRFAPTPSGYLHLGHIVSAFYVCGITQALGGKVILRIEDHDRQRSRDFYEKGIYEDLKWMGFTFANQEDLSLGTPSLFRQSSCLAEYENAAKSLRARGLVYRCTCSRKEILSHPVNKDSEEIIYPGLCRHKNHSFDLRETLRFSTSDELFTFKDYWMGEIVQNPAHQCGDFSLQDRRGNWTYHAAVVVDDIRHGVNIVIRGQDLLSSTARQIDLRQALGATTSLQFLHHPLLLEDNCEKLSKSKHSKAIRKYREEGLSPDEVRGEALFRLGLIQESRSLSFEEAMSFWS